MFCEFSFVKMSRKGKKTFVSIKEKLETLKRIDQEETLRKSAAEYGVGEATVGDWRWCINEIEPFLLLNVWTFRDPKKIQWKNVIMKKLVKPFFWFSQQRQKESPISGTILQQKALFF